MNETLVKVKTLVPAPIVSARCDSFILSRSESA